LISVYVVIEQLMCICFVDH